MESEDQIIRVYIPSETQVHIVRRDDFHPTTDQLLPSITALVDGPFRKVSFEAEKQVEDGEVEE